jgi:hypothetical protein
MVLSIHNVPQEHAASAELESIETYVPRVRRHGLRQCTLFTNNHAHTGGTFPEGRAVEAMSNEPSSPAVRSAEYGPFFGWKQTSTMASPEWSFHGIP